MVANVNKRAALPIPKLGSSKCRKVDQPSQKQSKRSNIRSNQTETLQNLNNASQIEFGQIKRRSTRSAQRSSTQVVATTSADQTVAGDPMGDPRQINDDQMIGKTKNRKQLQGKISDTINKAEIDISDGDKIFRIAVDPNDSLYQEATETDSNGENEESEQSDQESEVQLNLNRVGSSQPADQPDSEEDG